MKKIKYFQTKPIGRVLIWTCSQFSSYGQFEQLHYTTTGSTVQICRCKSGSAYCSKFPNGNCIIAFNSVVTFDCFGWKLLETYSGSVNKIWDISIDLKALPRNDQILQDNKQSTFSYFCLDSISFVELDELHWKSEDSTGYYT